MKRTAKISIMALLITVSLIMVGFGVVNGSLVSIILGGLLFGYSTFTLRNINR